MKKTLFKWGAVLLIILLIVIVIVYLKQKPTIMTQKGENNIQVKSDAKSNLEVEYSKLTQDEKAQYDKIKKAIEEKSPYEISFMEKSNPSGTIKYDFNNDSKIDTLNYSTSDITQSNNWTTIGYCTININDKTVGRKSEAPEGLSGVGIIDVDTKDNFVEFYIVDDYLAGGIPRIYRLTSNNEIETVCDIAGGIVGTSGDGKIYHWGGNLFEDGFNPDWVLSYYDIYKKDEINTNQIIGKTITAPQKITVYKEAKNVPEGPPQTPEDIARATEGKIVASIAKGETFKVIEANGPGAVKIQTTDGKQGWIGGFHMVWD